MYPFFVSILLLLFFFFFNFFLALRAFISLNVSEHVSSLYILLLVLLLLFLFSGGIFFLLKKVLFMGNLFSPLFLLH